MQTTNQELKLLANSGSYEEFEERWLELIEESAPDIEGMTEAAAMLAASGEKDLAITLLGLLHDQVAERGDPREALQILRTIGELRPGEKTLRPRVLACVRKIHADQPALDLLIEKSGLDATRKVPEALRVFEEFTRFGVGTHVYHGTGWGTGRVVDFDAATAELTVDFEDDKGHTMPIESAREVFEVIDDEDFRAYKFSRADELRSLCAEQPAEVLKLVVRSRGGSAQASEIRGELRGDVIPQKEWSKWWTKARREAAKDPYVEVQEGTKPVYSIRDIPVDVADEALEAVRSADSLEEAVGLARNFVRKVRESIDVAPLVQEIRQRLEALGEQEEREHAGRILEALLFLQDTGSSGPEGRTNPAEILGRYLDLAHGAAPPEEPSRESASPPPAPPEAPAQGITPGTTTIAPSRPSVVPKDPAERRVAAEANRILADIGIQELRNRFLPLLVETRPSDWHRVFPDLAVREGADLLDAGLQTLHQHGHAREMRALVDTIVEDPVQHPETFLAFARGYLAGRYPELPADPGKLKVATRLLLLYEKVQRRRPPLDAALLKKTLGRIEGILLDPKARHLETVLRETSLDEMRRIFHESEVSPYLSRELKSAIQTNVARTHPSLLTDRRRPFWEEETIYSTTEAIERKQEEFRILTEIKIPENSRAVGAAASLGDLSENSEYTAALESQRLLTEKAEELRAALDRARPLESQNPPRGTAAPGTRVRLRKISSDDVHEYRILGPWDAGEDDSVLSYASPLGKSLMGRKEGEQIEVRLPGGSEEFVIESIERLFD